MNMIERVARAICFRHHAKRFHPSKVDLINRNVDSNWHNFIYEAKAAIEAMKEPTEEMVDAGAYDLDMTVKRQYQNMIEAALKEE